MYEKIDLYNKKTKIYQTIKDLIILFIKLQFSIRCNQTFKPLYTSTSTSTSIPTASSLASYSMHLYHSNISYDSRHAPAEVFASNQVKPRPTYLPLGLGATGLLTRRPLSFPVNALIFMEKR